MSVNVFSFTLSAITVIHLLHLPVRWFCSRRALCYFTLFTAKSSTVIVFLNCSPCTFHHARDLFFSHISVALDWLLLFRDLGLLCPQEPVRVKKPMLKSLA